MKNRRVCYVVATVRVAGSLQKSTEVMTAMQNILRLSDVSDTMRELSQRNDEGKQIFKINFFTTGEKKINFLQRVKKNFTSTDILIFFFSGWDY